MSRLEKLGWAEMEITLTQDIMSIKSPSARKDLRKMEVGLLQLATELSKAEVVERRSPGSPGRRCNELEQQLLERYKYIQKMITIARLSF